MLDAATYVVSAVLIWAMILPRQVDEPTERMTVGAVWREMREGFAFLWGESALLANTLLSTRGPGRGRRRDRRQPALRPATWSTAAP